MGISLFIILVIVLSIVAFLKHPKFGKIYRDPDTERWWSKDTAGHGGSAWKVFKETSKGLEWEADTKKNGDYLRDKHKGPTGRTIPWKELSIKK